MTYDEIDRKIVASLRKDSSKRLLSYSAETGIPKSTLHERLRKLCNNGVRCIPLVDWQKIGYSINVVFIVPAEKSIITHPAVNSCQHVTPDLLLLDCLFRSMKDMEEFKEHLQAARYFNVIEVLKKEGFVP